MATYNSVQFVYATRPDVIPQYQAGSLMQTTVRLTDVKSYADATLVADYQLAYQQSGPSNRSRITTITLCGGGGASPATNVAWTNPTPGFGNPVSWHPGRYYRQWRLGGHEHLSADAGRHERRWPA